MANYSDLTRKEQVYAYLKVRLNAWVDGTELATAEVGGSEGLKRLRELRQDLKDEGGEYEIQMRGHPDPDKDIFQYRLIVSPKRIDDQPRSVYAASTPTVPVASVEPGPGQERPRESQQPPARRGQVHYDPDTDTYVAVTEGPVDEPPLPVAEGQVDMGVAPEAAGPKYTEKPAKLELGVSLICPMCKGIHRAIKERDPITGKGRRGGKVIGYEEMTRNPQKPKLICPRCNGWGLIPA